MSRLPAAVRWLLALWLLVAWSSPAEAQVPKVEVAVVGVLSGGVSLGTLDATLDAPGGSTLPLFRTSNRLTSGRGVEGLVSTRVLERLRVEVAFGWAMADFDTRVTSDFEGVPDVSLTQGVQQFSADAALVYRVLEHGRWSGFVRGAAGVFREITQDRALVDNGVGTSLGAGAQFKLRPAPARLLALRGEARWLARWGGIDFGDAGARLSPVFTAGLVVGW
jgi:hypothetical protein